MKDEDTSCFTCLKYLDFETTGNAFCVVHCDEGEHEAVRCVSMECGCPHWIEGVDLGDGKKWVN